MCQFECANAKIKYCKTEIMRTCSEYKSRRWLIDSHYTKGICRCRMLKGWTLSLEHPCLKLFVVVCRKVGHGCISVLLMLIHKKIKTYFLIISNEYFIQWFSKNVINILWWLNELIWKFEWDNLIKTYFRDENIPVYFFSDLVIHVEA